MYIKYVLKISHLKMSQLKIIRLKKICELSNLIYNYVHLKILYLTANQVIFFDPKAYIV